MTLIILAITITVLGGIAVALSLAATNGKDIPEGSKMTESEDITFNENHEIPDCGPPWACACYGSPGHDYITCPACLGNFQTRHPATPAGEYQ